tara:strand:+ start:329 stop:793 length:465 start_codon:yes stop_codon:yes gene_type:complete
MAANQTTTVIGSVPPRYISQAPKAQRQEVYGLGFPLGSKIQGGFLAKRSGITLIKNAVQQLLRTERGERLMLPNFGCNLRKFLFQPLDEFLFESIKREIQQSFDRYIVGAKIVKLAVFPTGNTGPAGGNSLQVILTLALDTADLEIFDIEVTVS